MDAPFERWLVTWMRTYDVSDANPVEKSSLLRQALYAYGKRPPRHICCRESGIAGTPFALLTSDFVAERRRIRAAAQVRLMARQQSYMCKVEMHRIERLRRDLYPKLMEKYASTLASEGVRLGGARSRS